MKADLSSLLAPLLQALNAGRTVLVPNTELAAALGDAVERAYDEAGCEVWPTPRIRDLSGWLKEHHVRRQLLDSTLPRCLGEAEERELWREAVLESDVGRRFLDPSGGARAARAARRAIQEYGIPMGAVAADGGEESSMFVEWSERFAARCRDLRCVDAAFLLGSVDSTPGLEAQSLAWIDSPLWRPVGRCWLERHGGAPLRPVAAAHGRCYGRFVGTESSTAELAAIAQWAGGKLAERSEFRAWICVPDLTGRRSALVDAFDAVISPHRFALFDSSAGAPYAVAGGTPLADYAPVKSALELLAVSEGSVPFARFSALLRAPELQESAAEAVAAARLDLALRSCAPSEARLRDWLALAESVARSQDLRPAAALPRLAAAWRLLVELTGSHPMSRWLSVWVAAFEAAPWSLRHRWSSGEYQAAERFRELLATLALGDACFGSRSRSSAQRLLRRAVLDTPFQVQTGIPPIWVSAQWMDPWLPYDGIWVAACDEAHWPPPVDPIAFLPVRLQRRHGLVAAGLESQLKFAEELQRCWLERAADCTFSASSPGEGRPAIPSPMLPLETDSIPAMAVSNPHWLAQLERAPPFERRVDEWAPPFGDDEKTRGVATLRGQSRCAFRGFAETRLRAEPLEHPVPGFNERERGELVHQSLEQIWVELRNSAALAQLRARPEELTSLASESARKAIIKQCERRDPGRRWREREAARLTQLLVSWLELEAARESFEVEQLEAGSRKARHAGIEFSVRVDRIDRLDDGSRVLIDYKTGAANRDWQGERPDNPQLPLYALLHRPSLIAVAYGKINAAGCGFVVESERGGVFPKRRATRLEGMGSLAALMDLWAERIERLADDFRRGLAAVDPTPSACRGCHLHGLCRVPSTMDLAESLDEPAAET